jgi:hypothetical protein
MRIMNQIFFNQLIFGLINYNMCPFYFFILTLVILIFLLIFYRNKDNISVFHKILFTILRPIFLSHAHVLYRQKSFLMFPTIMRRDFY